MSMVNGYYNPYQNNGMSIIPNTMPNYSYGYNVNSNEFVFIPVDNVEQVNAWAVAPGNTVRFIDKNQPRFYVKSVDIAGAVQPLRIYEFKEITEEPKSEKVETPDYVTKADLESALSDKKDFVTKEDFEKALSELKRNDKKGGK